MLKDRILISKRLFILLFLNFFVAVFLVIFTQFVSNQKQTAKSHASSPESPAAIIGGEDAKPGDFPYFTAIYLKSLVKLPNKSKNDLYYNLGKGRFCGGTLIGKKWVLTAAHCGILLSFKPDFFGVAINIVQKSADIENFDIADNTFFDVRNIYIHPKYPITTNSFLNDIALIELTKEVKDINPVSLPKIVANEFYQPGVMVTAIGFGCIGGESIFGSFVPTKWSNDLKLVKLPIITSDQKNHLRIGYVDDRKPTKNVCLTDSGGPYLYSDENSTYILGLISYTEYSDENLKWTQIAPKINSFTDCISRFIEQKESGQDAKFCGE